MAATMHIYHIKYYVKKEVQVREGMISTKIVPQ